MSTIALRPSAFRRLSLVLIAFAMAACGGSAQGTPAPGATTVPATAPAGPAGTPQPTAAPETPDPCPTAPSKVPDTIAQLAKAVDLAVDRLDAAYVAIPIDTRGSSGQKVSCVRPAVRGGIGVQVQLEAPTVKALHAACDTAPGANDPWVEIVCGDTRTSTSGPVQAALLFIDLEPDTGHPFTFHSAGFFANHVRADGSVLNLGFLPGDRSTIVGTTPGNPKSEYVDAVALLFLSPTGTEGAVMIVFSPEGTYLPGVVARDASFQPLGTSAFGFDANPAVGPDSPLPWLPFTPAQLP